MDSTRPIRALARGLEALAVLNLRNGATVSEVAQEIRLPRTTVYRILETLCEAGFAFRDEADDRYRLCESVRGLSDGFQDEPWVRETAVPLIQELSRDTAWPVNSTASGPNGEGTRTRTISSAGIREGAPRSCRLSDMLAKHYHGISLPAMPAARPGAVGFLSLSSSKEKS